MSGIKVSKKYASFGFVAPTMRDVDAYKQRMIISPKEERDAHNRAVEEKKAAKHRAKLEQQSMTAQYGKQVRTD